MDPIAILRWVERGRSRLGLRDSRGAVLPVDAVLADVASVPALAEHCQRLDVALSAWCQRAVNACPVRIDAPETVMPPVDLCELWTLEGSRSPVTENREADGDRAGGPRPARNDDSPVLGFKAPGGRIAGPGDAVGLRQDAIWHVPAATLTIVLDQRGQAVGFTLGDDVTAWDLMERNPLHQAQAKLFHHSAAIGPSLLLADTVDPYSSRIALTIERRGDLVFQGTGSTARFLPGISRLVDGLRAAWPLSPWTGVMVPADIPLPAWVALEDGDVVTVAMPEIGFLRNPVRRIGADWVDVPPSGMRVLRIDPTDTVAVALGALHPGQTVSAGDRDLAIQDTVPFGHKVALVPMREGEWVIKYGQRIGRTTCSIRPGQHVHVHNLESCRGRGDWDKADGP
ncbi:MAG: SAF domain-containing protein [Thermaerobacter sp.]|nr:SAF domain-containing protein [Thermaerobacter sp.]